MKASAFAPAHVSGLFAVHDEAQDPLRKGSRGAGWSLELGAHATATRAEALHVEVVGLGQAPAVTRMALQRLAPEARLSIKVTLDLPVGQGFGMSAAGTLASCLAAASVLGLEPERALEATHVAEVSSGTGLGDAVGSWFGAGEVRMKPGCPPHGWATRIEAPAGTEFLFCTIGPAISTPLIIRDAVWAAKTRALGDAAVDRILAIGRPMAWSALLAESARFSRDLGLMPEAMRRLGEALPRNVAWGQAMLGATLWAIGSKGALDAAEPLLRGAGQVHRCGVDENGARLVR